VHLPTFLQQKLEAKRGSVVEIAADFKHKLWEAGLPPNDIDSNYLISASEPHHYSKGSGKIAGEHIGAHFFTIGQRKGINLGGYKEPLFVIGNDIANNLLFVGEGQSHPGLYRKGLFIRIDEIHWIRRDLEMKESETREYEVRIRYRQPLQKAKLFRKKSGIYIIFHKLQRGIAPGQFAAWYDGEELIGSGVISM
jgi:tRNA-specific 2-thiouridylase